MGTTAVYCVPIFHDIRHWKQKLVLCVCGTFFVSLTLSLFWRVNSRSIRCYKKTETDVELPRDLHLQKDRAILKHLLLEQECSWQPNATALAQFREQLRLCCNASFRLVVTQENTPLGSAIHFDGAKAQKMEVKATLVNLLPQKSPFVDSSYERCAIVGNGGILRNSRCGQEIDQADLIVRHNLPPMNFSDDVGTKTNIVTVNPSIIDLKFQKLQERRRPFVDALRPYKKALFLIPAFSFRGYSDMSLRALYAMEDFGLMQQSFFLNPHYLGNLSVYWKNQGLRPRRLSSGFMLVSVALEFCQHITLYGFWPFPHDLSDQPLPHHYYDNKLPKPGVHAMPTEFSHYLDMYAHGVLRLRLGKC